MISRQFVLALIIASILLTPQIGAADDLVASPSAAEGFRADRRSTEGRRSTRSSFDGQNAFAPTTAIPVQYGVGIKSGQPNYIAPPNLSGEIAKRKDKDVNMAEYNEQKRERAAQLKSMAAEFVGYLKGRFAQPGGELSPTFYEDYYNKVDPKRLQYNVLNPDPSLDSRAGYSGNGELCNRAPVDPQKLAGYDCNIQSNDPLTSMACNIYFEALTQPFEGQVAVGESVVTRLYNTGFPVNGKSPTIRNIVYDYGVNRRGVKVAQYSWTFIKEDHIMAGGDQLDNVVRAAAEALCRPPGRFSNYWNANLVSPEWGPACKGKQIIGEHTFCYFENMRIVDRRVEDIKTSQLKATSGQTNEVYRPAGVAL